MNTSRFGCLAAAGLLVMSACTVPSAHGTVLTFDIPYDDDDVGEPVPAGYGDTAELEATFTDMKIWEEEENGSYGDLTTDVAFVDEEFTNGILTLDALPGYQIVLNSFQAGYYGGPGDDIAFSVTDENNLVYGGVNGVYDLPNDSHLDFTFNETARGLIRITFQGKVDDAGGIVGIDNVDFTVSPVPEPGSFGLLALGSVALLSCRRKKCIGNISRF